MSPAKKSKAGRRPGFGTVRHLPSGNLQASYIGPDGKRHNAATTFTAIGPARDWLALVRAQINKGTWLPPEEASTKRAREAMTFGEYAERWLATRRRKDGQPLERQHAVELPAPARREPRAVQVPTARRHHLLDGQGLAG